MEVFVALPMNRCEPRVNPPGDRSHRNRLHVLVTALWLATPFDALGATFMVNSTIDAVDAAVGDGVCATAGGVCTLRAAVQEANWHGGTEVITLPAGTYTFAIPGRGETDASAGDLDIWANITINGAGAATTVIDAAGLDRVFRTPLANPGTVSLTLNDLTVQNGDAGPAGFAPGGGFYIATGTRLSLTRVVVRANRASSGGGILISGASSILTVTDTTITGNAATSPTGGGAGGGGIYALANATATVSRSVVVQNQATFGAGILSDGVLNLSDSTVTGNGTSLSGGGGVYIIGTTAVATINRSTISGNNSGASLGAGLAAGGTTTVVNSTLSGNVGGSGAGIYQTGGTMTLINVTIASNSSATFGSLVVLGMAQVRNSIIANTAGAAANNCTVIGAAVLANLGNNLEFPGAGCAFNLPSDRRADPLLGPLADNGGPTQTHALLANSPAADAGDDAACAAPPVSGVDQRSIARPIGSHCDIGAYETGGGGSGFTDDPLISGITPVRAIHITELRARIDALRVRFGLQPFNWTTPDLVGVIVNSQHVQQLREALLAAYTAAIASGLNVTPPAFVDDPLVPQQTVIRAIHIEQLRAAVLVLEHA